MTTNTTIIPELLDQLLANYEKPEDLTGLFKQLKSGQTRWREYGRAAASSDCSVSARHSRRTERQCARQEARSWSGQLLSPPAPVGLRGVAVVQRDGAPRP
jgi:hypothetical protein